MNQRRLKKIWICHDVWMDILPFFRRRKLGLNLALISDRFDVLVDAHFDGKSELTIWKAIRIHKDAFTEVPKLSVLIDNANPVEFPWPDRPLHNKIRFNFLLIDYIDHSVVEFLRSNQPIWDSGTNLVLHLCSSNTESNVRPIWDVYVRQIWPIFTTINVHHLGFDFADHLDTLLRLTSPTILSDMNINSIQSVRLFPEAIDDDDGPTNTTSPGQMLSKWLHTPRTDGRPKKLRCDKHFESPNLEWINSFKEKFLRATASISYELYFELKSSTPIEPFELENERTKENLSLEKIPPYPGSWLLKRCPINGETAAIKWENEIRLTNLTTFRHATTFVSYKIQFYFRVDTMPIEQFELVNEVTNEKLTLKQEIEESSNEIIYNWLLKRCPIGETATVPENGNTA